MFVQYIYDVAQRNLKERGINQTPEEYTKERLLAGWPVPRIARGMGVNRSTLTSAIRVHLPVEMRPSMLRKKAKEEKGYSKAWAIAKENGLTKKQFDFRWMRYNDGSITFQKLVRPVMITRHHGTRDCLLPNDHDRIVSEFNKIPEALVEEWAADGLTVKEMANLFCIPYARLSTALCRKRISVKEIRKSHANKHLSVCSGQSTPS